METIKKIEALLADKRELFLEFEQCTLEMLGCPADGLEECLCRRQALITRIDLLDGRVDALAGDPDDPDTPPLWDALRNRGSRGDLARDLWGVYDAAAGVRAVLVRLTETETQAALRLQVELQRTMETIKSTNRGAGAQAARFISAADMQPPPSFHKSEA